jgi:hypothetical protein
VFGKTHIEQLTHPVRVTVFGPACTNTAPEIIKQHKNMLFLIARRHTEFERLFNGHPPLRKSGLASTFAKLHIKPEIGTIPDELHKERHPIHELE